MRAALIPVKELSQAKLRLAPALDAPARAELVLAMLTDVVDACLESGSFDVVTVISRDSEVCWQARERGAKPLAEPRTLKGLNQTLTFGQRYLARRLAASEIIVLPADIPLLRADDVRAIAAALGDDSLKRAALVRARDGGTNALALRPPEALTMRFGRGSADAHRDAARDAAVAFVELLLDRVAFDVDAPADVDALRCLPVGAATAGWLDAQLARAG